MNNNKTKNIILAVLVIGLVGMTIAYASLTQTLTINNNEVTVSSNWRVRFNGTVTTSVGTTISGTTTGASYTSNTPTVTNDRQTITGLQATFTKPGDYVEVAFTVQNEGNIAAKGQTVTLNLGDLTCTGSSIDSGVLSTFCGKLTKWVKHSDRTTEWSSADTLAAYSGSGTYPHIDGILRIEYPSTLNNADIEAINGGSITVTLGDTTLNFIQDDNPSVTPVVAYRYYTPTQTAGGDTLPDGSTYWIQVNTSTQKKEVCGVYPNATVCMENAPTGSRYDNFPAGCKAIGSCPLEGYAAAKLSEFQAAGGTGPVNQDYFNWFGNNIKCYLNSSGDVSCGLPSDASKCYISSTGDFYCS